MKQACSEVDIGEGDKKGKYLTINTSDGIPFYVKDKTYYYREEPGLWE